MKFMKQERSILSGPRLLSTSCFNISLENQIFEFKKICIVQEIEISVHLRGSRDLFPSTHIFPVQSCMPLVFGD